MLLKNWVYTLLLVFILGIITGEAWPVAFSIAVAVVFYMIEYWRRHALDHVSYRRWWVYRRGFPGEHLSVKIEIDNHKILPLSWLRVTDRWPLAVGPSDPTVLSASHLEESGELIALYSLRWFQRIERLHQLSLRSRGIFLVGPVEIESGDLLGMYEIQQEKETIDRVTVFPELLPMSAIQLPTQDPFGERRSLRRLFDDPSLTQSIRPYHPDDGFRRIHWPATARVGELQVKVYEPVSARVMVICLNVSTQARYWLGVDSEKLEYLVKVAATLVYQGIQDGYSVGLLSNGCLAHSDQPFHIPPGRSTDHLANLLTALASVTPFTTAPFESYMLQSLGKLPYGANLVVISAVINPTLAAGLLQLKRYRPNTTLFSLASEPPEPLPGIRMIHLEVPK